MIERYNGVLRQGLRKMASLHPTVPWTELLPTILAGLRFLPTRLGYPPAWVVFKQEVNGLPDRQRPLIPDVTLLEEAPAQLQEQLLQE